VEVRSVPQDLQGGGECQGGRGGNAEGIVRGEEERERKSTVIRRNNKPLRREQMRKPNQRQSGEKIISTRAEKGQRPKKIEGGGRGKREETWEGNGVKCNLVAIVQRPQKRGVLTKAGIEGGGWVHSLCGSSGRKRKGRNEPRKIKLKEGKAERIKCEVRDQGEVPEKTRR